MPVAIRKDSDTAIHDKKPALKSGFFVGESVVYLVLLSPQKFNTEVAM